MKVNNLILLFIMREYDVIFNDTLKIHVKDSSEMVHSLYFTETEVRIPLSINGIF